MTESAEKNFPAYSHLPKNAEYLIERNDTESLKKMLVRAAYLAKNETKRRGQGYRCFGGSNI
ncbi:inovirus-type Gp2 protein [Aeromonas caviae]|uniref:YagK/YfjJ domain-containing protein n=1 Tax=Aeromonas caviae TaxID=648 RepID=UPI00388EA51F